MSAAPIPFDEASRKSALNALDVLDTLPEAFSDAVSTAAAAIANVPISAISLVDTERQWFKGSCGLGVRETSRDVSFCAHAIHDTEPFLIPDALADPRFCSNPLVTGAPFIRAYAGFPIVVSGQAVGALCVIDDRPKRLTQNQIDQLSTLAAGTAAWLSERRQLAHSLSRTEAELRYVTLNDVVTGLPNRLVFQDRLKQAALRCSSADSLAVLLVDLDGIEPLNDAWGDERVNAILREIAGRLTALVAAEHTVARVGAHQFLVLRASPVTEEEAAELAENIATAIGEPFSLPGQQVSLSASIGVSLYPADGASERLPANADTAMAAAKRAGGNGHRFFNERMSPGVRERAELLDGLRLAGGRSELELYYQPKIDARSGQVTGAEALMRWNHPGRGMIGPNVFVPLAESAGLINELGHWVIVEACRQMHAWRMLGMRMRIAINLSVHQLRSPTLADEIAAELSRNDVEPSLLTCEITESVAMDDAVAVLDVFRRLKAIGVQLSIDDFGTGYSSLSYLRKLPVHQLKIDRSFVIDLADSEDARAVASAIVNLAHALRLEVVAEGVETADQRDILLNLGCDEFQGYLFAKPMSAASFTAWAMKRDGGREPDFRPSIFALGVA